MKKATQVTIKPDPANPNRMGAEDKARMAEFGDLSGIIINRRTGLLVGGHQRIDLLKDAEIITEDLSEPEQDGTVARGYLKHKGRKYTVRIVDWTEKKAHAAMLAANRFARVGQDDGQLLKDLLEELDTGEMNMDLTGFAAEDLENLLTSDTPMKNVDMKAPPKMAWLLIGVPLEQWIKISRYSEAAVKIPGSIVETTINDGI